jgi:proline iminopeptidase
MKAKIRGTEIYFDIAGMQLAPVKDQFVERPVLFMLHGGPGGDHLRFKQHSLELQEVAQLVFIDHRGSGLSKKTHQKEYTLENNIEDIEALRIHLGLEKICLLGTSYGGMVAQGYATRYPKRLEKLILVATAPSYASLDAAKEILLAKGNKKQIAISQHLWEGTFKNAKHVAKFFDIMNSLYSTKTKKNSKLSYSKSKTVWSHEALNEGFGGFLQHFNFISQLKKISCPTLVLAGQHDWICNPEQSKIIAKNIKHAELKIFRNSGHAVAVDAHKEYIKSIKKFLKGRAK